MDNWFDAEKIMKVKHTITWSPAFTKKEFPTLNRAIPEAHLYKSNKKSISALEREDWLGHELSHSCYEKKERQGA